MSRRPIQGGFDEGPRPDEPDDGVTARAFKDALSWWAATVTVVAVRAHDRVLATTVSSFAPVAAEPPLVVVSLGASAQVVPALKEGATFTVSLLDRSQERIASVYADSFPVGPSPFADQGSEPGSDPGPPVVEGALVALECEVDAIHPTPGGARLVTGKVVRVVEGPGEEPLVYWRREYAGVDAG